MNVPEYVGRIGRAIASHPITSTLFMVSAMLLGRWGYDAINNNTDLAITLQGFQHFLR